MAKESPVAIVGLLQMRIIASSINCAFTPLCWRHVAHCLRRHVHERAADRSSRRIARRAFLYCKKNDVVRLITFKISIFTERQKCSSCTPSVKKKRLFLVAQILNGRTAMLLSSTRRGGGRVVTGGAKKTKAAAIIACREDKQRDSRRRPAHISAAFLIA